MKNITIAVLLLISVTINCGNKKPYEIKQYEVTWQKIACPLNWIDRVYSSPNGSVFVVSEEAMAGDGPSEMYRTVDNGKSWDKLSFGIGIYKFKFNKNGHIFIAGYSQASGHFLRSTDNGDTWEEINIEAPCYY